MKVHVNKQTCRKLNTYDIFMSLSVHLCCKSNYFFMKPQGLRLFWGEDFYLVLVILQRKLSLLQACFKACCLRT
jgi:hypothetical protein